MNSNISPLKFSSESRFKVSYTVYILTVTALKSQLANGDEIYRVNRT